MKTTQTHIDTDTHKRAQPLPEPLSAEAYQAERISPTLRLLDLAPFEAAYRAYPLRAEMRCASEFLREFIDSEISVWLV